MTSSQQKLNTFQPRHDVFIAIDSDGCVFDTMELKQKECFIPNIIKHYHLQAVARYARQAAEFVNLYSCWRGINRFPGLVKTIQLLSEWPLVRQRHAKLPHVDPLQDWIEQESHLGNPSLEKAVEKQGDPVLKAALSWSRAVNETVREMVHGVPPFPHALKSLEKASDRADIIVCSGTPIEALRKEWHEHNIDSIPQLIAGQEMGHKKTHIQLAMGDHYDRDRALMIGDAPGDLRAARANNIHFYPILAGDEEQSWERFFHEAAERFFQGNYSEAYETELIKEFMRRLPETPPWQ
jgi:phosphoglycolate phosphatase-like HAD superfamily hydrolase